MADADIAQDIELKQWELNNRSRDTKITYQPDEKGYGPAECDECGNEMHPARRGYGFVLCVECQTIKEQRPRIARVVATAE